MNRWYCMDCEGEVELDIHGRCGCCGSEAIDPIEPTSVLADAALVAQSQAARPEARA